MTANKAIRDELERRAGIPPARPHGDLGPRRITAADPRDRPEVLRESEPDLDRLELEGGERATMARLEDERFYTGLGTLLEGSVRGIVREWRS